MEKDEEKVKRTTIKIQGWQIFLAIIFIIILLFLCTRMMDNNDSGKKDEKNPLIGRWMVQLNGELQDGNYFEFTTNNTFTYATRNSGIMTGKYTYSYGIKTVIGESIYSNDEYDYYYVVLTPEEVKLNDGRIVKDNLRKMDYAIGINGEKMISQNLISRNTTNLKLIK